MRTPRIPEGAEVIRTYSEYGQFVDGFFNGHYQLLVIVGRPGISKTTEFEQRSDHYRHRIPDQQRDEIDRVFSNVMQPS